MHFRRSFSKVRLAVALLLTPSLIGGWAPAKGKYKKWLQEEVVWIISKAEEEAFKALKDLASRERFIEEFWRRRDPTPSTERNEYKEEHYRRLAFANKAFREGIPGWKTDRGRVYILHGPPDSETFRRSRSTISPTRQIPSTARNPNTIVWTYHQLPEAKYYRGEMRLVFQPTSGLNRQSFVLSESKTAQDRADQLSRQFFPASDPNWMEADVRYRLVMAGPPAVVNSSGAELPNSGLGEFSKYQEDILRSPGELLEERERERRRRSQVLEELAEVETAVGFESFKIGLTHQSFWRDDDQWWVPISVSWDWTSVQPQPVDVYVVLQDAEGVLFDEFIDSVEPPEKVNRSKSGNEFQYSNSFVAPSGEYVLRVVARGVENLVTAVREEPMVLSRTPEAKLRFDGLLLTNRVEVLPEGGVRNPGNGIVFNRTRLLPSRSRRFRTNNYLLLYFQLCLPESSSHAAVNINFIRDGEIVMRMDGKRLEKAGQGLAEYGSAFSLEDFKPGVYTLQVQAIDYGSRSYRIKRTRFEVESAELTGGS